MTKAAVYAPLGLPLASAPIRAPVGVVASHPALDEANVRQRVALHRFDRRVRKTDRARGASRNTVDQVWADPEARSAALQLGAPIVADKLFPSRHRA